MVKMYNPGLFGPLYDPKVITSGIAFDKNWVCTFFLISLFLDISRLFQLELQESGMTGMSAPENPLSRPL